MPTGRFAEDITGRKFNHLLVVSRVGNVPRGSGMSALWLCKCDCGKTIKAIGTDLKRGYKTRCSRTCKKFGHKKGQASFNLVYYDMKRQAGRRGIFWELSKEKFREITSGNCHYCGDIPHKGSNRPELNGDYIHNGIDRVDNNVGYVEGNCVSCCWICNRAKGGLSTSEFISHISKICRHWASKS